MNKIKKAFAVALVSSIMGANAYAETGTVAIGPRLSTQGIGAEISIPVSENVFARINGNYFPYKRTFNSDGIHYKGKLTLLSAPLMLDWHPVDNSGFRLSVGVAYNGNQLKAKANPNRNVTLNNHIYTPDQLGTVSAKLTLGNAVAGVASIGYDGAFVDNGPFSFNCELGVMYTGKPKLKISTTGVGGKYVEEDVRRNAKKALNDAEKYLKLYPIVALGFKYAI